MQPHALIAHVQSGLQNLPAGGLAVGYSGGMDSTVLLHVLAGMGTVRERGLRAIHVDHGLHADSARWSAHCVDAARDLDVKLQVARVEVHQHAGQGLEAATRDARLALFATSLAHGEILVLAQHADDQAETVLLKLLRGAGPEGLGGMREWRTFGHGSLWRPMLKLPRSTLLEYARSQRLTWVDDPSNADTRLRRNFLRHEILPRLHRHWPQANAALAHSARWARAAASYIDDRAHQALREILGESADTLSWRSWLDLPDALRDPVLRLWLRSLGLDEPAHFHVVELQRQLTEAAIDRMPCLRWAGTEVRRYRDHLYAMRALIPVPGDWRVRWDGSPLALPTGDVLELRPQPPPGEWPGPASCLVRFRRGGEKFKPAGSRHTRDLRTLLQERAVPPWTRSRIPLVFVGGELVAVGDRMLSDVGQSLCERLGTRLVWRTQPHD